MTTQTTDDDTQQDPNSIESLRQAAERAPKYRAERDTATAERDAAKRELAFMKAGINPDAPGAHPALGGWVKGYDGSLDNPDEIRQAAIAASLITAAPQDPAIAAQASAEQRVQNASQGATLPNSDQAIIQGLREARETGGQAGMEAFMRLHNIPITDGGL